MDDEYVSYAFECFSLAEKQVKVVTKEGTRRQSLLLLNC